MGLSVHKFENLVRQETTPAQQDYFKGILPYGNYDNFPLRLARLVQNSPTASSCIDTISDFITGNGFSEAALSDLVVNGRGERFGDIHSFNGDAYGLFTGCVLNIKYNRNAKISEIYNVPFEYCRFGIPDSKGVINKIKVNPFYGTSEYKEENTKEYDTYNPTEKVVRAQMARDTTKYKGQILYIASTAPLSRQYPAPKYYSCNYFMAIDEAIGGFHKHNIENNFFQGLIISMIGDENGPSMHPDDVIWDDTVSPPTYTPNPQLTNAYRFNVEMQKFSGWEKAGNIMTLWSKIQEEKPTLTPAPTTTNAELFNTLQNITTEQIARATKVPPVLANINTGATLGGDGNVIRASVKLMQQRVAKTHAMMERIYKELLSHLQTPWTGDVKILHYNPFPELEKVDPLIWAALPNTVQLAWIKKNTDFEIPDVPQGTPTPAEPTPAPANSFSNVFYDNYPESAKKTAQKVFDFKNNMQSNCGSKKGWEICNEIIAGKPLSYTMIRRIHNYLDKNTRFSNGIFSESCEAVMFAMWGGTPMLDWAKETIKSING